MRLSNKPQTTKTNRQSKPNLIGKRRKRVLCIDSIGGFQ